MHRLDSDYGAPWSAVRRQAQTGALSSVSRDVSVMEPHHPEPVLAGLRPAVCSLSVRTPPADGAGRSLSRKSAGASRASQPAKSKRAL